MTNADDVQLVERARRKDLQAFGELVERWETALINAAYSLTSDWHIARDLAQEAFVICYRRLEELQNPGAFGGWARQIVVNLAKNHLRERKNLPVKEIEHLPNPPAVDSDPLQQLEEDETKVRLARLLDELPQEEWLFYADYHLRGIKVVDMAQKYEIAPGTVSKRLSAISAKLRAALAQDESFANPDRNRGK